MLPRFFAYALLPLLLARPLVGHAAPAPTPSAPASPTDTVALTLPEAEQRFLNQNLSLLAQRYNVSAAEAQIQQARLWDNPTVSIEQNTYNPTTHRALDVTRTGESIVQVQQLFALAGRRRAAANAAQQAALAQQYTLQDLLRTLRYQLRTTFYDLYFQQQSLGVYDSEIRSFQHTVGQYQGQYEKGNVALKEVIRLRAFLFGLQNERQQLLTSIAQEQADLHVLLRDEQATSYYRPQVASPALRTLSLRTLPPEAQLADSAQARRADVQAREAQLSQQQQNLRLQRALATPDLAVGYVYDRAGSYIQNYNALTLGVAVPLFNRNQGNIRTAQAQLEGSRLQLTQQQQQARTEVHQAYELARQADEVYQASGPDTGDFDRLIHGIEQSYAQRNLTIVEFLDFYESYKNNLVQRNQLRANRMHAFEQLNYAVGQPLLHAE